MMLVNPKNLESRVRLQCHWRSEVENITWFQYFLEAILDSHKLRDLRY